MLRIIQERCFERVGGTKQSPSTCGSLPPPTRSWTRRSGQGRFREDLYYRLNVVPFQVPALRERREDIPLLVQHFVAQFYRREGRESKAFHPEALGLLSGYDWPGNVRELKNIVERILIMTPGRTITAADVPELLGAPVMVDFFEQRPDGIQIVGTLREAREGFEREFIIQKLEENDWNISRTAEVIELERSNLHRKIKSYGIDVRK